jgi:hypothetical protein
VTSSYLLRLFGLSFAAFFLLHAVLHVIARWCLRLVTNISGHMPPREAARLLFAFRLLPALAAGFVVLGLCVPSYLWFEPQATPEDMGLFCALAAIGGLSAWLVSFVRASHALFASCRYLRECRRAGREMPVGINTPAVVLDHPAAVLAVCGLFRPVLFVSRDILSALSPEQLEVALSHERVHRSSAHNFKRLLLLLLPDVFPFRRSFQALEARWAMLAEWAADDEAAAGDAVRAISLASALVRVAQLGLAPQIALSSSFTDGGRDLEARVDRLLHLDSPRPASHQLRPVTRFSLVVLSGCLAAAVVFLPAVLPSVYRLLEDLVR